MSNADRFKSLPRWRVAAEAESVEHVAGPPALGDCYEVRVRIDLLQTDATRTRAISAWLLVAALVPPGAARIPRDMPLARARIVAPDLGLRDLDPWTRAELLDAIELQAATAVALTRAQERAVAACEATPEPLAVEHAGVHRAS